MVIAAEMAKPFGKRPVDWQRLSSTISFLTAFLTTRKSGSENIAVKTIAKNPNQGGGTWMHEDIALEFARWLAPEFSIWCYDRIMNPIRESI